ncbi:MAG: flagellar hook-associated protein FlgK [Rhodopseudomonas sp.]|uniref:flagellar hook-associated protein FlgK n=1 Tax=Rhodopseudomonas sp. TaxID=1078 RepID=UPI0017FC827B|nr:flagellar hook-associated protein FlgK [Rhodopseudomonas sp.]NVN87239.1 flagellar hook-associated protein FlgK [Rhodopseudomonas sp.]
MSLDIASRIAVSSLMTTQVQMSVASANISNADTNGYTEKAANQESVVSVGTGAGTTISGITSNVDKLLLKSLSAANSDLGAAETRNSYLDQLQNLYGSSGSSSSSGTSIANTIASLEAAISSLSSTTNSASLQSNVVSTLDSVASQLRETSSEIQNLRGNADKDIASSVDDVNQQLKSISDLNAEIKQTKAAGQSTADLEDKRNTAMLDVASKMNVSYFVSSSGDMQVYTTSGQVLVDSSAHKLSYTAASSVTASTTYSATSSSGLSGITVNGVDVTSQITSGKIGGLINLRDTVLTGAQAQLDQLANQLSDSLNTVHNQGTSIPPPSTLTGTATVSSSTALSASGTVRIAMADQKGNLVSYQDLDLSTYSTVGDLVSGINGISGLSASIDSNGHVVIASTSSSNGVAINEMSSKVGSSGAGLSDALGLNDLVTGTGASNFAVRSDILSNSGRLAVSTLDSSTSLTTGRSVLSSGSTKVVDNLYSSLTASNSYGAAGGLGATSGSVSDYASAIVSSAASKASEAKSTYTSKETAQSTFSSAMSSQSGVNLDEETARLSTLQNQYSAVSELIKTINAMFSSLLDAVKSSH